MGTNNVKSTTKEFIIASNKMHNNRYDYTQTIYINARTKVVIICKEHGTFEQRPDSHLVGSNCRKCTNYSQRLKVDDVINRGNEIHDNKYDYSLMRYNNIKDKVIIICPKHGDFEQTIDNHLSGKGCMRCKKSKGEMKIRELLINNNISFIEEATFPKCKYKRVLSFDFYLHNYNICIEYDGAQHFKSVAFYGGDTGFKLRLKRDNIKTQYCIDNNIDLIRIPYYDYDNIETILSTKIF